MSEQVNVSRLRKTIEAMWSRDLSACEGFLADDIEWWDFGGSEPVRGRDAAMQRLVAAADEISAEAHDVLANAEHMIVLVHAAARRRERSFYFSFAEVYHLNERMQAIKRQAFTLDAAAIVGFLSSQRGSA